MPTFLIVGAQKSGTRWLRTNLGEHPDVFTAPHEVAFFDGDEFDRGLGWYGRAFKGWRGEPAVGEATPGYLMLARGGQRTADRIHRSLPGVRLLALLRNPVDRAYSAFIHHMGRDRIPAHRGFLEQLRSVPARDDPLAIVSNGWYAASLAPYLRFGDRVRILIHDDALREPEAVYSRALDHIGARQGFIPRDLRRVRFTVTPPATSPYAAADGFRRPLTPLERREAYAYFADDVERLEAMIGRDLSAWRPPRGW